MIDKLPGNEVKADAGAAKEGNIMNEEEQPIQAM